MSDAMNQFLRNASLVKASLQSLKDEYNYLLNYGIPKKTINAALHNNDFDQIMIKYLGERGNGGERVTMRERW